MLDYEPEEFQNHEVFRVEVNEDIIEEDELFSKTYERSPLWDQAYYDETLKLLDDTQREYFDEIADHVMQHKQAKDNPQFKQPKPIYRFITGPGGTGKSKLISLIDQVINRNLSDSREKLACLLSATTGSAAFGIGGATLHRIFGIGGNYYKQSDMISNDKKFLNFLTTILT